MLKNTLYLSIVLLFLSCGKSQIKQGEVIYIRNKGADMPAYVYGNTESKTFMILLHGGPGGNGLEYRSGTYAELLEKDIAVIYWDQRGQGNSRGNGAAEELNMDLLLDDLDQLVLVIKDLYGNDISLFLYGHSWGGTYGTKYLMSQKRQNQFKGWIESDGAHDIPHLNIEAIKMFTRIGNEQIALGENISKWEEIVDYSTNADTNNLTDDDRSKINSFGQKAEGLISEISNNDDGGIKMSLLGSPIDPVSGSLSGNATSNTLLQNGIEDIALTDSLYKISIPSLLLWGKYDFVVPPQLGVDAIKLIGSNNKKLIIYNKSGHSPMNNEGEKYAADILDFIAKNK